MAYKQQKLFLAVLEAESTRSGCSLVPFWWRPFSGLQTADFPLCPHDREAWELSWASSVRALISLMRAMSSWCNHHSEAPFPNTIILGIRIPICEFWGHTSIQTTALNIIIMSLKCRKSCGLLHQWMQIRGWGRVQRAVSLLESPWSVLHCLILEHDWMNKKCEML